MLENSLELNQERMVPYEMSPELQAEISGTPFAEQPRVVGGHSIPSTVADLERPMPWGGAILGRADRVDPQFAADLLRGAGVTLAVLDAMGHTAAAVALVRHWKQLVREAGQGKR